MTYPPTPRDPWQQEGAFNSEEQPPRQAHYPPPQGEYPPPQPAGGYPPAQPEEYRPAQPGEYTAPPTAGGPPRAEQPPAGAAGTPTAGAVAQPIWGNLSRLGQVVGIAGLLGLIFFFLPWSFSPDVNRSMTAPGRNVLTASHSGWSTASGLPMLGGGANFNLFPHLWLVLASMVALIVIAVLLGLNRIGPRLAAILITLISLFALLLEILFLVQMNSFQGAMNTLAGGQLNQTLYGVSWGFWVTLAATVVALGVGAYMLYQEYAPEAPGMPRAPRIPGSRQPHPTT